VNSRFRLGLLAIVFCISSVPAALLAQESSPESPTPTVTPTPALSLSLPRPRKKATPAPLPTVPKFAPLSATPGSDAQLSRSDPAGSLPSGPAESASLASAIAAADQVKAKAEAGDAAAEYDFGIRHVRGDGVPKDYPEAVKWLRKAAEQDYAEGQRQLGNAYFYGKGVEKDYDQAFAWYSKAARAEEKTSLISVDLNQA
jgi:hypothetical protein